MGIFKVVGFFIHNFSKWVARSVSLCGLLLALSLVVCVPLCKAQATSESRFTLNARPSFETVDPSKRDNYLYAQSHGYCEQVLEIEQDGLVKSRPEFQDRFSVGVKRNKADQTALEIYALGFRRCKALRHLSIVLAVPKLKAGNFPYSPFKPDSQSAADLTTPTFSHFAPKPRLGIFFQKNKQALDQLILDRTRPKGLDRPIDWARSKMPLDEEILLHTAFTDLYILALCHSVPEAYQDIGRFFDVQFSALDPYINYGLFQTAISLNFDKSNMEQRLVVVGHIFPPSILSELEQQSTQGQLHKNPRLSKLFGLCQAY